MKYIFPFILSLHIVFGFLPAYATESGILKIESDFEGVKIFVNDSLFGETKDGMLLLQLPPGSHRVSAQKPNFETGSYSINIQAGRVESLKIELRPRSGFRLRESATDAIRQSLGSLTIITDIPGATIFLNGSKVPAKTPFTLDELGAGEWLIEATVLAFSYSGTVVVQPDSLKVYRIFFDDENRRRFLQEQASQEQARLEAEEIRRREQAAEQETERAKAFEALVLQQEQKLRREIPEIMTVESFKYEGMIRHHGDQPTEFRRTGTYNKNFSTNRTTSFNDIEGREHVFRISKTTVGYTRIDRGHTLFVPARWEGSSNHNIDLYSNNRLIGNLGYLTKNSSNRAIQRSNFSGTVSVISENPLRYEKCFADESAEYTFTRTENPSGQVVYRLKVNWKNYDLRIREQALLRLSETQN